MKMNHRAGCRPPTALCEYDLMASSFWIVQTAPYKAPDRSKGVMRALPCGLTQTTLSNFGYGRNDVKRSGPALSGWTHFPTLSSAKPLPKRRRPFIAAKTLCLVGDEAHRPPRQ